MKKFIFIVICTSLSSAIWGQSSVPQWIDSRSRSLMFPKETYYTGDMVGNRRSNETEAQAIVRVRQGAVGDLTSGIRAHVHSQATQNTRQDNSYNVSGEFASSTEISSQADVTNVKVEHYVNREGVIHAFAYVKRVDLIVYYTKQISVDLGKVETALGVAEQLVSAAKKMSARRKIEEAKQILNGVSFYRDLLVAVDALADESELQAKRSGSLQRTVEQRLIDLEQSTFVYMNCSHEYKGYKDDAFSSDPNILCDIVAQALSENECSVTDNKNEADYELTLVTSTTQRSDGTGQYGIISYYANVRGTLYNRATRKTTANFSILNDPSSYSTGRSPEDAATKAFKRQELTDKVLEKILPKVKD